MLRYSLFCIFFLTIFLSQVNAQGSYPPIQQPLGHLWPYKYDSSLEPTNPRNLAGLTVVVTGDSTQWGQGNAIARLYKENGCNVYGFSRKSSSQVYNRTWDHFSGDLRSEIDVAAFVIYLKSKGVTKIDALFLNAGVMMNLYPQDLSPINMEKGPIDTNFFGNYRMYYYLLRGGLLPVDQDVRIIWTGSIGSVTHFQPITSYAISKAMINNYVQQITAHLNQTSHKMTHYVINPFGVATQISCHNQNPILAINEICDSQTDQVLAQANCNQPFNPNPAYNTMATDVALMGRTILRNRDPVSTPKIYVIDSGSFFPLDSYGGRWDRWFPLWHSADTNEYARDWLGSALSGFYPVCSTYPA